MPMTLVEAAKHAADQGQTLQAGVIALFAANNRVTSMLSYSNISGNAVKFNLEDDLSSVGYRAINEGFDESTGVINPQTENLAIIGGDMDIDLKSIEWFGDQIRTRSISDKMKSLSHTVGGDIIKGDSATNPRKFDGLQKRVVGNQLLTCADNLGAPRANGALSLFQLDQLMDLVQGGPTHLIMPSHFRLRLTEASRNQNIGGVITFSQDEFGRQVTEYNGVPIVEVDRPEHYVHALDFNEVSSNNADTDNASIYAIRVGEGYVEGLQNGPPQVRDLGELHDKPTRRVRMEWAAGLTVQNPRAVARLRGLKKNVAITV